MSTSIPATVNKASGLFSKFVLPIASFAIGYFAAPGATFVMDWLKDIQIGKWTNGNDKYLIDAFNKEPFAEGVNSNGVLVVSGFVMAAIGFYLFSSSGFLKTIGLGFLGASTRLVMDGSKGVSYGGG